MKTRIFLWAVLWGAGFAWQVLAAGGDATPKFKDEGAAGVFAEGKTLFESADYKEAEKRFKDCQDKTDAEGKKVIKLWLQACKGGMKLAAVTKAIASKNWRSAEAELAKLGAAFGETPLRPRIEELLKQVGTELYAYLATFEEDAPQSEKAVKGRSQDAQINTDASFVKRGLRSLKWHAEVEAMSMRPIAFLPLARMENFRLDDHSALHISIYSPDESIAKFTVFFDVGDIEHLLRAQQIEKARGFFHHITLQRTGWTEIRIDLAKELSTYSNATRDEVQGVSLLMVAPAKPKTIYVDEVRLEKK